MKKICMTCTFFDKLKLHEEIVVGFFFSPDVLSGKLNITDVSKKLSLLFFSFLT